MSTIVAERQTPYLVTIAEAGRLLCMKPWPIVELCQAGELKHAYLTDPSTGAQYLVVSVESVRDYARRVTA